MVTLLHMIILCTIFGGRGVISLFIGHTMMLMVNSRNSVLEKRDYFRGRYFKINIKERGREDSIDRAGVVLG